jgi:hypothetical protein
VEGELVALLVPGPGPHAASTTASIAVSSQGIPRDTPFTRMGMLGISLHGMARSYALAR